MVVNLDYITNLKEKEFYTYVILYGSKPIRTLSAISIMFYTYVILYGSKPDY